MTISEKAAEYIALSKKKKSLQSEMEELEGKLDTIGKDLYDAFIEQNLDGLSQGGYLLKPVLKFTANARDERTVRVLRRRGYGHLVKPVIHPSTAHAFIREMMDESGGQLPQWVRDNFKIVNKETVSMRKE